MPDHLHLLVMGTEEDSDLIAFAHSVKQRTAYQYRRAHEGALWQKGYYEHVLRDDEATLAVARYILENPIRGGLVTEPRDYAFSGSFTLKAEQLDELWHCEAVALGEIGTPSKACPTEKAPTAVGNPLETVPNMAALAVGDGLQTVPKRSADRSECPNPKESSRHAPVGVQGRQLR